MLTEQVVNTKNRIIIADATTVMKDIEKDFYDQIILSPAYFNQRVYHTPPQIFGGRKECCHFWREEYHTLHAGRGDSQRSGKYSEQKPVSDTEYSDFHCDNCNAWKGELGLEHTLGEYIDHLVECYDQCKRVLKKTGTMWIVIGDKRGKNTNWMLVPQRLQIAMEEAGWINAMTLIWEKTNPMPSSSPKMFKPDFEFILVFAKHKDYYLDKNAVKIPLSPVTIKRNEYPVGSFGSKDHGGVDSRNSKEKKVFIMPGAGGPKHAGKVGNPTYSGNPVYNHDGLRHLGSVWEISTQARFRKEYCPTCDLLRERKELRQICHDCNWEFPKEKNNPDECQQCKKPTERDLICSKCREKVHSHYAMFPEALIEPMVRAGCPQWCCKKCGKPRITVYDEERIDTRPGKNTGSGKSGKKADPNSGLHNSELSHKRQIIIRRPIDYKDTCNCPKPKEYVKGRVLDPNSGFGTTVVVAILEGREGTGIELHPLSGRCGQLRLDEALKRAEIITIPNKYTEWHP